MNQRSTRTKTRTRELGAGLMLMTLSVAVVLLLLEGAVRALAPQQLILVRPDVWQPVDVLGWKFQPEIETRINTGERTVTVRTDAHGYRIGNSVPADPARRILLLGDSFMAAIQVPYEDSVPGQMEHGLTREFGEPVRVLNTGVGGWDTPHYLIKARRMLGERDAPIDPIDLVVVAVYLGNDIVSERIESYAPRTPAPRHAFRLPRSLARTEWIDAVARPIDDVLKRRSHLYILVKNRLDNLRTRLGLTEAYFPSVYLRASADSQRWAVTADMLQEIAELGQQRDIATLFVLIPSHFQVHSDNLETHLRAFGVDPYSVDMNLPNERLGSELQRRGLAVVDTTAALRAAAAEGTQVFGTVDTHLAPEGHAVVWRAVETPVLQALSGTPKARP